MRESSLALTASDIDALGPLAPMRTHARLHADSRLVCKGDAFVVLGAESGQQFAHALDALARGAGWLLCSAALAERLRGQNATCVVIDALERKSGALAAWWYGTNLTTAAVVAVTGTNGKTTCTQWIAQGVALLEGSAAVVGTLGAGVVQASTLQESSAPTNAGLKEFGLTTPDVVSWHRMLAEFAAQGVRVVAVEASSIGLHQGRLDGSFIDTAVFTNLTQDHLDYHGTLDAYAQAKALLFSRPELRQVVVNAEDAATPLMLAGAKGPRRIAYALKPEALANVGCDHGVWVSEVSPSGNGFVGLMHFDATTVAFTIPVLGRYNLANALAVAAVLWGQGAEPASVVKTLAQLKPVAGRLQTLGGAGEPLVVVDYAHTPDALANVLQTLAEIKQARQGRLWCVFGAGGDRDPSKRPLMGQQVDQWADEIVLTSDNPRSESPQAIARQVLEGIRRDVNLELDRAAAIALAVSRAAASDVVLVAGKGHETTQTIGSTVLPFSDVEHAGQALAHRRERAHA
jgi:UDP-N-acetylmuramoyl-L-alanyl-D-glutamate--2,6-diaminopimelate ligase